jgi:hypothetical protein
VLMLYSCASYPSYQYRPYGYRNGGSDVDRLNETLRQMRIDEQNARIQDEARQRFENATRQHHYNPYPVPGR